MGDDTPKCRTCGAPLGYTGKGRPLLYCQPEPGRSASVCRLKAKVARRTPKQLAHERAMERKRYAESPEIRAREAERNARWRNSDAGKRSQAARDQRRHRDEAYRERHREMVRANARKPEVQARRRERQRAYRKNPDHLAKHAAYQREYRQRPEVRAKHVQANRDYWARLKRRPKPPPIPTGSVLMTASPRAPGRSILVEIMAHLPRLDDSTRDDVIGEAALMMCEGIPVLVAIETAKSRVIRQMSRLRYAKPIEDCFWL